MPYIWSNSKEKDNMFGKSFHGNYKSYGFVLSLILKIRSWSLRAAYSFLYEKTVFPLESFSLLGVKGWNFMCVYPWGGRTFWPVGGPFGPPGIFSESLKKVKKWLNTHLANLSPPTVFEIQTPNLANMFFTSSFTSLRIRFLIFQFAARRDRHQ